MVLFYFIEGNVSGEIFFKNENIENKIIENLVGDMAYIFQNSDSRLCLFTVEDEITFDLEKWWRRSGKSIKSGKVHFSREFRCY